MSLASGARLGPYEVLAPLGAGGMGEVYKARDSRLNRLVAVKILPPALALSDDARERFEREARSISRLSHPHVCALFDVGREGDTLYLVMELLDGETLKELVARGPVRMTEVLRIGAEIAEALAAAAKVGITHRDLKPGNVMLTRSGVKLLDFGLAKTLAAAGGDHRDRTGNGSGADGARHVAGHGALHVARAVRGAPCRRAQRCLRARSCSLRDGDRSPRIWRRHRCGHRVLHPALRTATPLVSEAGEFPHSSIASFVNVSRRTRTSAGSRRTTSRCSLRRSLSPAISPRLGRRHAGGRGPGSSGRQPSSSQPCWRRV